MAKAFAVVAAVALVLPFSAPAVCAQGPGSSVAELHVIDIKATHPRAYHPHVGDAVQLYLRVPVGTEEQTLTALKLAFEGSSVTSIGKTVTSKRPGNGEVSAFFYAVLPGMSYVTIAPIPGHTNKPIRIVLFVEDASRGQLTRGSPSELCSGRYVALQISGNVFIFAEGDHPTAGYEVFFKKSALTIFPPQFSLLHVKPTGVVPPVLTPFTATTSFGASEPVEAVVVRDRKGRHRVTVQQVASKYTTEKSVIETLEGDESLSVLLDLLNIADMAWIFTLGGQELTLLAPTNQAFMATVPEATFRKWEKGEDVPGLREALAYHVISQRRTTDDLMQGRSFQTWGGQVDTNPAKRVIRVPGRPDARFVKEDVSCSNGIVHAIDRVLLPLGIQEVSRQRVPSVESKKRPPKKDR